MPTIVNVNYFNVPFPDGTLQWKTLDTDPFHRDDVANTAVALDKHDHSDGYGLAAKRLNTSSVPANPGDIYITGSDFQFIGSDDVLYHLAVLTNGKLPVSSGGTGDSTLLNHAVLLGAGTSPINTTSVGPDHSVLQGHTGADPAFTTTPTVDGLTDTGDLSVAGTATIGTLHVTGNEQVDGDLNVDGTTTLKNIVVTGTATGVGSTISHTVVSNVTATGAGQVLATLSVPAGNYMVIADFAGYLTGSGSTGGQLEWTLTGDGIPATPGNGGTWNYGFPSQGNFSGTNCAVSYAAGFSTIDLTITAVQVPGGNTLHLYANLYAITVS